MADDDFELNGLPSPWRCYPGRDGWTLGFILVPITGPPTVGSHIAAPSHSEGPPDPGAVKCFPGKCDFTHVLRSLVSANVSTGVKWPVTNALFGDRSLEFERFAQPVKRTVLRWCARERREGTMGEVEYELLLDVVRSAIAPEPQAHQEITTMPRVSSTSFALPKAANDNQTSWPLIPFPDDWHAAC